MRQNGKLQVSVKANCQSKYDNLSKKRLKKEVILCSEM